MSWLQMDYEGSRYVADSAIRHDISIPLDFHGTQPNHFGAMPASAEPMTSGDFVGDTRAGGSCNAEVLRLNPHCNGTHTECVGHVTEARLSVLDAAPAALLPAVLLSVETVAANSSDERTRPAADHGDRLITAAALGAAWSELPGGQYPALVVRTLPNSPAKMQRRYTADEAHAFFTLDAIELLVDCGVEHLLVDTPSLDRFDDGGQLAAHRLFWRLPPGARKTDSETRVEATVTEMVFVDDSAADGIYLLDLQVAPFRSDAAPSRPLLYPARRL